METPSAQALLLAAALVSAALPLRAAAPTIYADNDLQLIVHSQELKVPAIEKLLDLLKLQPGMSILDIGAGSGQQSYRIAERLKGTGHVYATDIDPQLIAYINDQAHKRGLANLQAFQVRPDGFDGFYGRQKYDLVLIYDVDNYLQDRPDYYRQLRSALNPGARVVIVESESTPNRSFYQEDVADWPGLLEHLRQQPPESPLGRAFEPLSRVLHGGPDAPRTRRMVVFELNRLLDVPYFLSLVDGAAFKPGVNFLPDELSQALWMLDRLRLDGFPGLQVWELQVGRFRQMQLLNKLLLIQDLRPYLSKEAPEPYWSLAPESMAYIAHDYRVREFEEAGYRLALKQPFMPFWNVWIFQPR